MVVVVCWQGVSGKPLLMLPGFSLPRETGFHSSRKLIKYSGFNSSCDTSKMSEYAFKSNDLH